MQEVQEKDYIDVEEAKAYIKQETGVDSQRTLRTAAENGKVRTLPQSGTRRVLYKREDVQKLIEEFNTLKGNLLTVGEAYSLFKSTYPFGYTLTYPHFLRLVMEHNIPTVDALVWRQQLFAKERVIASAHSFSNEKLKTLLSEDATLFTIREAVAYLQQKWPDADVKIDTLRRMVYRGNLVPVDQSKDTGNFHESYHFSKKSIDALAIRSYERQPTEKELPEPVYIANSTIMEELAGKYGELIASSEAIKIVQEKSGRDIDNPTIMTHLRKKIGAVGYTGSFKFYPKSRVEAWVARPMRGQRGKTRVG